MNLHPLGKYLVVKFVHGFVNACQHLRRVLMPQELDYAFHAVGVIPFMVGKSEDTFPLQVTVFEFSKVAEIDRYTVLGLHYNIAHVLQVLYQPDAPDHIAQVAPVEHTSAGVGVVLLYLFNDVGQGKVVLLHFQRINLYLKLRGYASEVAHIGNTCYLLEPWNNDPFVQFGKFA